MKRTVQIGQGDLYRILWQLKGLQDLDLSYIHPPQGQDTIFDSNHIECITIHATDEDNLPTLWTAEAESVEIMCNYGRSLSLLKGYSINVIIYGRTNKECQ